MSGINAFYTLFLAWGVRENTGSVRENTGVITPIRIGVPAVRNLYVGVRIFYVVLVLAHYVHKVCTTEENSKKSFLRIQITKTHLSILI